MNKLARGAGAFYGTLAGLVSTWSLISLDVGCSSATCVTLRPAGRKSRGGVPAVSAVLGDVRLCEVSPLVTRAVWKCPIPPAMTVSSEGDG